MYTYIYIYIERERERDQVLASVSSECLKCRLFHILLARPMKDSGSGCDCGDGVRARTRAYVRVSAGAGACRQNGEWICEATTE